MLRLLALTLTCLLAFAAPALADHRHDWDDPTEEPAVEEPAPTASAPFPPEQSGEWDDPAAPESDWPDDEEWPGDDDSDDDWPRDDDREDEVEQPPIVQGKAILGRVARLRADGKAAVPLGAPQRVRRVISALNEIVGKPYKWGGGHGRIFDRGYDCSGAVSYGLIRTGLLGSPLNSTGFMRWAAGGAGRWMTVYTSRGHAYLEIAGLRLDTSSMGDRDRRSGVRWRQPIGKRPGFRARHVLGL